jgi:hypothetical protein
MIIIMKLVLLENISLESNTTNKIKIKTIRKDKIKTILTFKLAMLHKMQAIMVLNIYLGIKTNQITRLIINITKNINPLDNKLLKFKPIQASILIQIIKI